jgi:hypothetical protein
MTTNCTDSTAPNLTADPNLQAQVKTVIGMFCKIVLHLITNEGDFILVTIGKHTFLYLLLLPINNNFSLEDLLLGRLEDLRIATL